MLDPLFDPSFPLPTEGGGNAVGLDYLWAGLCRIPHKSRVSISQVR